MDSPPRAWVLNLDAEHELEAVLRYAPTDRMRANVARESRRLIGPLVAPHDIVVTAEALARGGEATERARGLEGLRDPGILAVAGVLHRTRLAVHQPRGVHDGAAEAGGQRLVAEAHAEQRSLAEGVPDELHRQPGVFRSTGSGADHHVGRVQRVAACEVDPIVPDHVDVGAEHHQRLGQVPGEGVVVVDDQQHDRIDLLRLNRAP